MSPVYNAKKQPIISLRKPLLFICELMAQLMLFVLPDRLTAKKKKTNNLKTMPVPAIEYWRLKQLLVSFLLVLSYSIKTQAQTTLPAGVTVTVNSFEYEDYIIPSNISKI